MATRITPLRPGESSDPDVNQILQDGRDSWWSDAEMFGTIARGGPELLKTIVPVFGAFFGQGKVEPHIHELMRIKTGQINDCAYWSTVRTAAVRGVVTPKEDACLQHQPKPGGTLNEREAAAISLAERIALDPHTVTDEFFAELREHFSDEEIVEMTFACGIFNWGNKFNITMNMDTEPESEYDHGMEYRREDIS